MGEINVLYDPYLRMFNWRIYDDKGEMIVEFTITLEEYLKILSQDLTSIKARVEYV